jgi:hypothetical protein
MGAEPPVKGPVRAIFTVWAEAVQETNKTANAAKRPTFMMLPPQDNAAKNAKADRERQGIRGDSHETTVGETLSSS